MRSNLLGIPLVAVAMAAVLPSAAAAGADAYYVVLDDGSWVRAAEKPIVLDGRAQVRLPGGLLAEVDASRIDWRRSDERSRMADVMSAAERPKDPLPQPRGEIEGTFTIVGQPGAPVAEAPAAATAGAPAAPAPPAAAPDRGSEMRDRIRDLDQTISDLSSEKRDLEARAHSSVKLDDAARLRERAAALEAEISKAREERDRLLREMRGQ